MWPAIPSWHPNLTETAGEESVTEAGRRLKGAATSSGTGAADTTTSEYINAWTFQFSFFVIVIVIQLNMIFGIILDSFRLNQ